MRGLLGEKLLKTRPFRRLFIIFWNRFRKPQRTQRTRRKSNALRPPRPLWLIFFESTQKKLKSVSLLIPCQINQKTHNYKSSRKRERLGTRQARESPKSMNRPDTATNHLSLNWSSTSPNRSKFSPNAVQFLPIESRIAS